MFPGTNTDTFVRISEESDTCAAAAPYIRVYPISRFQPWPFILAFPPKSLGKCKSYPDAARTSLFPPEGLTVDSERLSFIPTTLSALFSAGQVNFCRALPFAVMPLASSLSPLFCHSLLDPPPLSLSLSLSLSCVSPPPPQPRGYGYGLQRLSVGIKRIKRIKRRTGQTRRGVEKYRGRDF